MDLGPRVDTVLLPLLDGLLQEVALSQASSVQRSLLMTMRLLASGLGALGYCGPAKVDCRRGGGCRGSTHKGLGLAPGGCSSQLSLGYLGPPLGTKSLVTVTSRDYFMRRFAQNHVLCSTWFSLYSE